MYFHIFTVYDGINPGSFFQALALKWELEKYGYVDFVNTHGKHELFLGAIRSCCKRALKLDWRSISQHWRKYQVYRRAREIFPQVSASQVYDKYNDIFVYGSDEIWNVRRRGMRRRREFFGEGFPERYRIAAAPSVNRTTAEEILAYPYIEKELRHFTALSSRDSHTKELVEKITGQECSLISDPTLMFGRDRYEPLMEPVYETPYLLIYSYGNMLSGEVKRQIKAYAQARKLKVIAIGTGRKFSFCDKVTVASPGQFLSYMDGAEAVVTDTFHGLMFSLIMQKQFFIFPIGNIKVENTLDFLGLTGRLCSEGKSMEDAARFPLNYREIQPRVEAYAACTRQYLADAAGRCSASGVRGMEGIEVLKNEPLSKHSTIRIGGVAEYFFIPANVRELKRIVDSFPDYRVLSGGSNLLINDQKIFPCVISMAKCCNELERMEGNRVYVGASVRIQRCIRQMGEWGLGGFEFLYSLPALMGGILYMNAGRGGAKNGTPIADYVVSVRVLDEAGAIRDIPRNECGFAHRKSIFQQKHWIILGAVIQGNPSSQEEVEVHVQERLDRCKKIQDMRYPNLGSIFCRSNGQIMKLMRLAAKFQSSKKSAGFSERKTNWIVNRGEGTFQQAFKAIQWTKRFHKLLGRSCEVEVRIWE